ncbi:MAG: hypothetical protein AAFR14_13425 [Bacteroidota bacterium]
MRLGLIEYSLIQVIIYALVYLLDSYIGFLLCLICGSIGAAILVLSLVFELIDRSKVPRSYYLFMLSTVVVPILVMGGFSMFMVGSFSWMEE